MKTKLLSLIVLGFISLITMQAMSVAHQDIPNQIETKDVPPNMIEIYLYGDMVSNPGPNTVEAYYNDNMVVVCFHQNYGHVSITLLGETGNVVYSGTANSAIQQTVYIPIAGVPCGSYTLILGSMSGSVEGGFSK